MQQPTVENALDATKRRRLDRLMARWHRLARAIGKVGTGTLGSQAMCVFNAEELAEALALHLEKAAEEKIEASAQASAQAQKPGGIRETLHKMLG